MHAIAVSVITDALNAVAKVAKYAMINSFRFEIFSSTFSLQDHSIVAIHHTNRPRDADRSTKRCNCNLFHSSLSYSAA